MRYLSLTHSPATLHKVPAQRRHDPHPVRLPPLVRLLFPRQAGAPASAPIEAFGAMRIVTSGAGFVAVGSARGMVDVMVKVMVVTTAATPSPTAFPHVGRNQGVTALARGAGPFQTGRWRWAGDAGEVDRRPPARGILCRSYAALLVSSRRQA